MKKIIGYIGLLMGLVLVVSGCGEKIKDTTKYEYNNVKMNFKIEYPSAWTLNEDEEIQGTEGEIITYGGIHFLFSEINDNTKFVNIQSNSERVEYTEDQIKGTFKTKSGIDAIIYDASGDEEEVAYIYVFDQVGDNHYVVNIMMKKQMYLVYEERINKMLRSLEIIK